MLPPSYIMRPTKVKHINKPLGVGISGEKINLSGGYKNSINSNSTALSNVINLENQRNIINVNNSLGKISYNSQNIDIQNNYTTSEIKKIVKKR